MWGWWKEPSGEFCLVHDWKCLDSIFLPPDAFSSHLNTINLKILEEKFMQGFSNFYCFFGYKKITFKSSDRTFPWLLNSLDLPSHGTELWKRCTPRLLLMSRGRKRRWGKGGNCSLWERANPYLVKDLCGGTRIRRKLCLITLSV